MGPIEDLIFIYTIASSIYRTSCSTHNESYVFIWQTVAEAPLSSNVITISHFEEVEERQKLCFYAMMASDLPYIDYNYVPEWYHAYAQIVSPYPPHVPMNYGIKCATLPTIYIVRKTWSTVLAITRVQALVHKYKFDTHIIPVNFVTRKDHFNNASDGVHLLNLDMEDRRNLCDGARKNIPSLHFLHHDVAEAWPYEFVYRSGGLETDIAIACPTLPQLYLRRFQDEIKLLLLPSFVGDLDFEEENVKPVSISFLPEGSDENMLSELNPGDQLNLCNIARRNKILSLLPFVTDTNAEAHVYSFEFPSGEKRTAFAIFCPAIPRIYLRLENSTTRNKIILTFLQNQADQSLYTLELFEEIVPINNVEIREAYRRKMETERHLFTTLGKETLWNFCFVAQKSLLKMEDIIFRFVGSQSYFWNPKILLIPKYMEEPRLYRLKRSPTVVYEDFIIKCSAWPEMYLRLGESETHIRTMLLRKSLVQTFPEEIIISRMPTSEKATTSSWEPVNNMARAFMSMFSLKEMGTAEKKKGE